MAAHYIGCDIGDRPTARAFRRTGSKKSGGTRQAGNSRNVTSGADGVASRCSGVGNRLRWRVYLNLATLAMKSGLVGRAIPPDLTVTAAEDVGARCKEKRLNPEARE